LLDSLNHTEADTFLIYSLECLGGMRLDTGNYYDPQYLFWKQKGNIFLKKFDDCKLYKAVLLDSLNPLTFYLVHKNQIDREEIKNPTYLQSRRGNVVTEITSTIDHTCFYEMTFLFNGEKKFKRASDYDLTFIKFDNRKRNIYYKYNQQTKLKLLIDKITTLLTSMNSDKKFDIK
jgi:hypothetical protein